MSNETEIKTISSKRKIIDAAKIEFAEHGLAGARVDRIAALSGVNKAMIYYHFKGKEQLYREIIRDCIDSLVGIMSDRVGKSRDLESVLEAIVETYHQYFTPEDSFVRPILLREMASGGGMFAKLFHETFSQRGLPNLLLKTIEDGIKRGEIRDIDGRQTMISFIGMNIFYLLMSPMINQLWNITDEKQFRKERNKIVIDIFLNGIKAR